MTHAMSSLNEWLPGASKLCQTGRLPCGMPRLGCSVIIAPGLNRLMARGSDTDRTFWQSGMRDGIYQVDFRSGRPEGYGIAMVREGLFRGLDHERTYYGQLQVIDHRISGDIRSQKYLNKPKLTTGQSQLKLDGTENDLGFKALQEHLVSGVRHRVIAKWIAPL